MPKNERTRDFKAAMLATTALYTTLWHLVPSRADWVPTWA